MLNKIIAFSLSHRLLICCGAVLLIVAGVFTAQRMEVDVFPDLNAPTVVVMTEARGMAAEEVERLVTFPIETVVNGATDVRRVRSSSTTGFSVVWVEFDWGTDIYIARQIVSEKLQEIGETLPQTVGKPTLGPQSSILGEVMFLSLSEKKETTDNRKSTVDTGELRSESRLLELRTIADWIIRPRLLANGGVAQVTVLGGDIKEYNIKLHTEKMSHYGVTLTEVLDATRRMTDNAAGGIYYEYGNEYIVRGMTSTNNLQELRRTPIARKGTQPIMLDDIADVEISAKSPKMGVASVNGNSAVLMTITKQPNTGTIELTQRLDKEIADIKAQLPEWVEVHSDLYRQQNFIDSSISNIQKSLIEGAIFVILVLFIFLMNARTMVISLVTIPISLLVTILVLKLLGMTINTMSIGGMAIAIGSLVDDAIVDVENVYKRLREARNEIRDSSIGCQETESGNRNILRIVYDASREVRIPILNSTIIIVVSFIPLFFLSGIEGRMLAPLGVAFIISLFASTLVALTLTPVLCSLLLGGRRAVSPLQAKQLHPIEADIVSARDFREPLLVRLMKGGYGELLQITQRLKWGVITAAVAVFILAMFVFVNLGHSFLPPFNEGSLTINLSTFPGVSLEESDKLGRQAENILLSMPKIKSVARKTGRAELDEHALGVNVSEMECALSTDSCSKEDIVKEVREKLKVIPGVNIEIGQPISHRIDAMLSGTQANIAIKVFGSDLNKLYSIGQQIKAVCKDINGVADLNVEQQVERPQLTIKPRRDMLARYGITIPEFAEHINVLLGGEVVSQVFEGNRSFDLTLKADDNDERTEESLRQLRIDTKDNEMIPLEYVADISSTSGSNTINRENVSRKLVVSANASGMDVGSVVNEIQQKVSMIEIPDDYHIEYGGQFESEKTASRILFLTSLLSILVIFLILYQQFHSLIQAAVILINLPLALIGGVFALHLTGGVLSIPAIIGFISLFGIATRNGMLLVERFNVLRHSGLSVDDAIRKGSLDRLNPIIMTALTSTLALIPLALGGDLPGNEIQSPMAKVMLGGLISSTILNAFIVPAVYKLIANPSTEPRGTDSI